MAGRYCAMIRRAKSGGPKIKRLTYTENFPKSPEPFVSPGQVWFHKKADRILGDLGLQRAEMLGRFGPTWAWQIILVANELARRYLRDPASWPKEEVVNRAWDRLRPYDQNLCVESPPPTGEIDCTHCFYDSPASNDQGSKEINEGDGEAERSRTLDDGHPAQGLREARKRSVPGGAKRSPVLAASGPERATGGSAIPIPSMPNESPALNL
jgi:hypothetical protein